MCMCMYVGGRPQGQDIQWRDEEETQCGSQLLGRSNHLVPRYVCI